MPRQKNPKNEKQSKTRVTGSDIWKPNPYQIRLVELLVNPEDRRTKEEKCKEAGVTRKTLYEWLKKPEFVEYMNSQIDKYTDGELPDIWKSFLMQCKRGNVDAIKYLFKVKRIDPEILLRQQEIELKRQEVTLKNKTGSAVEEAIKNSQVQVNTLAALINNPQPNRKATDFE